MFMNSTFKKASENLCRSLSAIPALEISRLIMFTCHLSQLEKSGPIWQDCSSTRPDAGRVPEAHHHLPDAGPTPGVPDTGAICSPVPMGDHLYIGGVTTRHVLLYSPGDSVEPLWPPYVDLYIKIIAKQN